MNSSWRAIFKLKIGRGVLTQCLLLLSVMFVGEVSAHSSSNSYLTLSSANGQLTMRADIHLRDVDLTLNLDENQDGQVTWGEVMRRRTELQAWLSQGIALSASGESCDLGEADLQASRYADGLYLSAMWTSMCPGLTNLPDWAEQTSLRLRYNLMFDQDDLHRGLLKVDFPSYQSSALLSPDRPETQINATNSGPISILLNYLLEGVWHIWIGIDHIVFLLSLLVLAPLQSSRQRVVHWHAAPMARPVVIDVFAVVTAFTVAHSITLGLTITGWLTPPADLVEPAIALSVVLAALNNLLGFSALKRWRLAFVFGLIHGFGFANVLLDLGLPASALLAALGGFNIGVEVGQLAIVAAFLPLAWTLRRTWIYRWVVVVGGSIAVALFGLFWSLERVGWLG